MFHSKFDIKAMKLALKMAESVKGATGDNPAVGAVIYNKDRILACGATQKPGQAHAEIEAIKKAGVFARGACMAVTLEPCCHFGRTPPCTTAIIQAGISKVIAATPDPNPKVSGKGLKTLSRAGIRVSTGLFEQEASAINEDFFKFIRTGRPFVILKAGMTLNGMIAADSGHSKWITSESSRKIVHAMRARTDAVLIGMDTARKDNPLLTVRHIKGRNPVRIILSSGRDLPRNGLLAKSAGKVRTILMTPRKILRPACKNVEYVMSRTSPVPVLLKAIGGLGIKSLLVEGGQSVFTQFISQKGVDLFYLFMSPKILMSGLGLVHGRTTKSVREAMALKALSVLKVDDDILVRARP